MPLSSVIHQTVRTLISFGKRFGHTQQRWMRLYAFTSPGQETKYHGLTIYLCLTAAMTISPWVFPVATAAVDVPVRRDITLSGAQLFEETLFSQGSTVVKTSGEYSKLFSFIVGADFLQQFYDDGAVMIRLRGSQKLAEGLIRAGVTFADNRGMFVVTARELRNKLEFQFNSATQEEWVREAQVGAEVAFKFENIKIGSYLTYAQTPSKELDNQVTIKDTTTLYEEYTRLKRIAGGTRAEGGLTADFQMTPDTTIRLGGGARKKMVDWSNGQITTTEGTYEAGIRTRLTKRDMLNLTGRGSSSLVGGELRYTHVTSGGVQSSIGISGEQQKESRSDVRLMVGVSIPFGVDGPALPAAKPVERNPMPKIVSSHVIPQSDTGARSNRFTTADIKQLVGTVPAYAAGYLINAAVDTTTVDKLALSIDKTAISGAQVVAGGNISYSLATGSTFGAFNTGASNVGADAFTLTNSGQTIVINPTILGNYLPATATATSPATLTIAFVNSTVTVVAYKGSVHIKSVTVASSIETTAPVAVADTATTAFNTAKAGIDVLANDTDNSGIAPTLTGTITNQVGGTFVVNAGKIDFTPTTGFTGAASTTYQIKDAANNFATGTLTVTVGPDTTAPVANADTAITANSTAKMGIDVLANDTDNSGATPTLTGVITSQFGGTFVANAGKIDFTPTPGFTGVATAVYQIKDAANNLATGTLTVAVGMDTIAPIAVADPDVTTSFNAAKLGIDVLANDTDNSGVVPMLTGVLDTPVGGSFIVNAGKIDFTPTPGFSGAASVTYQIRDTAGNLATAKLTVTVTAQEVPPVMANAPDVTGNVGTAITPVNLSSFVTMTNADTISSYSIASGSLPAGLTLNTTTGVISGTPTATGTFIMTVTATDNDGASNPGSITFNIGAVLDIIPPLTDELKISTPATDTTVSISQTISETGIGYYLIQPAMLAAPTIAEIKAKNNTIGMTANTPAVVAITGLVASSTYRYYFVAKDVANNVQTTFSSLAVTTTATPVPPVMGNVPDQTGTVGAAITPINLATSTTLTNGDAILSYAVIGTLPAGLTLNTTSGVISGTPTTAGAVTVTVTATDKDGTSNADSILFTIS